MDGNRRWADITGTLHSAGHSRGGKALMDFCRVFKEYNIPLLTVYAFSKENNERSEIEKKHLFGMLKDYLANDIKKIIKENILVRFVGDFAIFSDEIRCKIEEINTTTIQNAHYRINIALNYSGREEIISAFKSLKDSNISEDEVSSKMQIQDVDLLIRTGGKKRLSNFLPWQSIYAELYFTNTLWPAFTKKDFDDALEFFCTQKRNFGK